MTPEPQDDDALDDEQLILGDLLNHVLDKGVVITGSVIISIADIDLLMVDLRLLLSSVETSIRHGIDRSFDRMIEHRPSELRPLRDEGTSDQQGGP